MGCVVTHRDTFLFRKLSSGPANLRRIVGWMNELVGVKDPSAVVRNRSVAVSENVVKVRLHKLMKGGYVQSRHYRNVPNTAYALYALTLKAVQHLGDYEKMESSSIRAYLPSPRMVAHELGVTEVVRRLREDAKMMAGVVVIRDEQCLRGNRLSEARLALGASRVGDVFPDLHVLFSYSDNTGPVQREFAMEVDNATIPGEKVAMKLERVIDIWKWRPVVLCTLQVRIDDICRALIARGGAELGNNVLFGLLSEYCKSGVIRTQWQVATGRSVALIRSSK